MFVSFFAPTSCWLTWRRCPKCPFCRVFVTRAWRQRCREQHFSLLEGEAEAPSCAFSPSNNKNQPTTAIVFSQCDLQVPIARFSVSMMATKGLENKPTRTPLLLHWHKPFEWRLLKTAPTEKASDYANSRILWQSLTSSAAFWLGTKNVPDTATVAALFAPLASCRAAAC